MRVIAGTARGTRLRTLDGTDVTRPTVDRVKEAMFSSVQSMLGGARVLDLFAGSGQLGIEALSRGAQDCVFVDEDRAAAAVVRANCAAAGVQDRARDTNTSAQAYLHSCRQTFDLVLLDPPYRAGTVQEVLPLVERVLSPGGVVLAETEYGCKLPETCGSLKLAKQYKYGTVAVTRYEKSVPLPWEQEETL